MKYDFPQTLKLPDKLKAAIVTFVFNYSQKKDITYYRPMSSPNSLSKMLGVCSHVEKFLLNSMVFLQGSCVEIYLCMFTYYASKTIGDKQQLDTFYVDCAICWKRLCYEKISLLKVSDVEIGQSFPQAFGATSSVPQGSNLVSVPFLIFINSL